MKRTTIKKCFSVLAAATSLSLVCTSVNAQELGDKVQNTSVPENEPSQNLLRNPSFEDGMEPWNGSSHGTSTKNPCPDESCGPTHYHLDGGWIGQVTKVPYTGYYKVSTWLAAGGEDTNVYFGANNNTAGERHGMTIDAGEEYGRYEQQVWLNQQDEIDVFVLAKAADWVNGDNFCLEYNTARYPNLAVDPQFDSGKGIWETTADVSVGEGQAVLASASDAVSQTIKIPMDGSYYAEAELYGADGATVTFQGQTSEPVYGDQTIKLCADSLAKDEEAVIRISGKAVVKKVTVRYDLSKIQNDNAPEISDFKVSGEAIAGQVLEATYEYKDLDGHPQGPTIFRWMLADSADGQYKVLEESEDKYLTVKKEWEDQYLKLETTVRDQYEKEGNTVVSDPIGPVNVNLAQNIEASQEMTVERDGYYDFSAKIAGTGKVSICLLDEEEKIIAQSSVTAGEEYQTVSMKAIPLEYRQKVSFCLQGAAAGSCRIDDVRLIRNREKGMPSFNSIVGLEVSPAAFETDVDLINRVVTLSYLYGDKVSALRTKNVTLSQGASADIKAGDKLDLTKPVSVTVTGKEGNKAKWKIRAVHKQKKVKLSSSNKYLQDTFNWAAHKLDQFVMTGKSGVVNKDENRPDGDGSGTVDYIPSYWAGYYDRTAFYSRDFVHQAAGAQIAGLSEENYTMFETFAKECTKNRKYYTVWALNFDGTPHTIDYHGDDNFVREVPAQFELVEKAYQQYLWSGDKRYIENEDLFRFYTNVMTKYVDLHDTNKNGIAEGTGGGIFEGTASYNERSSEPLLEAGDAIGSQYQATLAYAGILEAKADILEEGKATKAKKAKAAKYRAQSKEWYQKAAELKTYFNQEWSVADGNKDSYARGLSTDGKTKYTGFGKENSWFLPMKRITNPGKRNNSYMDMILENLGDGIGTTDTAPSNLEAYTYIPDMLFPYNRSNDAWKWMKYITSVKDEPHERPSQGTNGDYPEISFTFVSHVTEGMMGIEPDAGRSFLATSPRLPDEVSDVTAEYIDIGDYDLELTHNSNLSSKLTNHSKQSITWEARFYGNHKYIKTGNKYVKAKHKKLNGVTVSYVSVKVKAGASMRAKVADKKK